MKNDVYSKGPSLYTVYILVVCSGEMCTNNNNNNNIEGKRESKRLESFPLHCIYLWIVVDGIRQCYINYYEWFHSFVIENYIVKSIFADRRHHGLAVRYSQLATYDSMHITCRCNEWTMNTHHYCYRYGWLKWNTRFAFNNSHFVVRSYVCTVCTVCTWENILNISVNFKCIIGYLSNQIEWKLVLGNLLATIIILKYSHTPPPAQSTLSIDKCSLLLSVF